MDKQLKAEIEAIVKQLSDRKLVEIDEIVDKELIGGFILNMGDRQIDASIRSKLKSLQLKFSENPYAKEL
jgi:F-type H+-transporting ATPase subunit delta